MKSLTVYCNAHLTAAAAGLLRDKLEGHKLLIPPNNADTVGVLGCGAPDSLLGEADIAFGQPDVDQIIAVHRLAWIQLTSAGYSRYDRPDVQDALRLRGAALTNSSVVYAEPCALHLLAFICGQARQLPAALDSQRNARAWPQQTLRARCRLLRDESAVIFGLGSIGRRLVDLLAPLRMRLSAIRRRVVGDEPLPTFTSADDRATRALSEADHVIDLLPESPSTTGFFDARRIAQFKPGAIFYNIGRGTTVDQDALRSALCSGNLGAAYLDVTTPEPLPPDHPLWSTPNCFITPHTGGGQQTEALHLVRHFLENLARFEANVPLLDRVA